MLFMYFPELSTNVGETTVVSGVLVRNDILILDCFPADNWKAQAARTRNRLSRKFPRSSVICTEEIANLWYEPLSVSISERDGFPPGRFLAYQQCQLIYITVLNMFQGLQGPNSKILSCLVVPNFRSKLKTCLKHPTTSLHSLRCARTSCGYS